MYINILIKGFWFVILSNKSLQNAFLSIMFSNDLELYLLNFLYCALCEQSVSLQMQSIVTFIQLGSII